MLNVFTGSMVVSPQVATHVVVGRLVRESCCYFVTAWAAVDTKGTMIAN